MEVLHQVGGVRVLEARLAHSGKVDGMWGLSTDEDVAHHIDIVAPAGSDVAPTDIWDPSLLDAINDFDEQAVRQEAAAWTP